MPLPPHFSAVELALTAFRMLIAGSIWARKLDPSENADACTDCAAFQGGAVCQWGNDSSRSRKRLVEATGSIRCAAVPHHGCCWKIPREAWSLPVPWLGKAFPAGSLGLASTRSPDSASPTMSAISAAWSPPRATETAATTRPLAAAASEIPAIGPEVAHTDPASRPVWAVASPTPPIRSSNPVSPDMEVAAMPAAAIGRDRTMSVLTRRQVHHRMPTHGALPENAFHGPFGSYRS